MADDIPAPDPGGAAGSAKPQPAKDFSGMTPDELLLDMFRSVGPMAPDRPRGFNPALHRQTIRDASIIFARTGMMDVLMYAEVDGRRVSIEELSSLRGLPCITVRCEDEEDMEMLWHLIAEVKHLDSH